MGSNHYTILGVSTGATQREIKVAYRKLVQLHHPDTNNSENDEMIKLVNVAYETLSDPIKRAQYDLTFRSSYQPQSQYTYNTPYYNRPRRSPPPHSYFNRRGEAEVTYVYSTKTKLQGFAAVTLTILIIFFAFIGSHYYASIYYFDKGQIAEKNQNYPKAFSAYRLAIRDWGIKNIEATIRMIEMNRKVANYGAMLDKIVVGFSFLPDSVKAGRLYFLQGIGLAHTDNYLEAEKAYLTSLQYKFSKDSVYTQLGALYLTGLHQYNDAVKIYTYLLLDDVNSVKVHYHRALSYQQLGKHDLAIDDLLLIIKLEPFNGRFLFQLGRSYLAIGQKEKGCEYLRFAQQQGIKIAPEEFALACD